MKATRTSAEYITAPGVDRVLLYDGAWITVRPRWWLRALHVRRHRRAQAAENKAAARSKRTPRLIPPPPKEAHIAVRQVEGLQIRHATRWWPGVLVIDAPNANDPWRPERRWRGRRPHRVRYTHRNRDMFGGLLILLREDTGI